MALSKRLRPVSGSFRYPMMPSKMDPRRQLKRGSIMIFKMSLPVQNHSMLLPSQNLEYSKVLWCFVILHLCATLPQLWPLHPYFTKYEQNICELIEKNKNHKSRYDWCTTDPISIVMFIYTIIYSIKRCSRYVPFWKNDIKWPFFHAATGDFKLKLLGGLAQQSADSAWSPGRTQLRPRLAKNPKTIAWMVREQNKWLWDGAMLHFRVVCRTKTIISSVAKAHNTSEVGPGLYESKMAVAYRQCLFHLHLKCERLKIQLCSILCRSNDMIQYDNNIEYSLGRFIKFQIPSYTSNLFEHWDVMFSSRWRQGDREVTGCLSSHNLFGEVYGLYSNS